MALQVTKTTSNGLDVSYWRVKSLETSFDDSWTNSPSGQLFRFQVEGYHNADYRAQNAGVESHQYHVTGSEYTAIVNAGSGDLRPGIYDWLKAQTSGSPRQAASNLTLNFFSSATNV